MMKCGRGLAVVIVLRRVDLPPHGGPELLLDLFRIIRFVVQHVDGALALGVLMVRVDASLVE